MSKKETAKRYVLFIISLFFSALGVAFTKHGELGVSPISSVANVLSCTKGAFSLGVWLIIWNCVLILGQIIILRKKFQLIQLLQIPLSFLFGYFTDFGLWLVDFIPAESYIMRLVMVVVGIVILGFGVTENKGKVFNEKQNIEINCTLKEYVKDAEKMYINMALEKTDGNVVKAAKLLGIHRSAIYRKLNE